MEGISPISTFFLNSFDPLNQASPILKTVLLDTAKRITMAAIEGVIWAKPSFDILMLMASTSARPDINPVMSKPFVPK